MLASRPSVLRPLVPVLIESGQTEKEVPSRAPSQMLANGRPAVISIFDLSSSPSYSTACGHSLIPFHLLFCLPVFSFSLGSRDGGNRLLDRTTLSCTVLCYAADASTRGDRKKCPVPEKIRIRVHCSAMDAQNKTGHFVFPLNVCDGCE